MIPQNSWRGRRCFVIGGGPSLKGFDWDRLNGELTIAVNQAMVPAELGEARGRFRATVGFSADYRWQNAADHKMLLMPTGPATLVFQDLGPLRGCPSQTPRFEGLEIVGSAGRRTWSEDLSQGLVHATHSGAAALNLAYLLGANPIYLLGFDYQAKENKTTHYHDDYPDEWRGHGDSSYGSFLRDLRENIAPHLKKRQVYNVTKEGMSALDCFPKMLIEDVPPPPRRPLFVTAYTDSYEMLAAEARGSFDRFGIDLEARHYKDRGSWVENVAFKPRAIRAMLQESGEVCWVDADARLCRYPSLFDNLSADVAVHWLRRPHGPPQACPGTVYVRDEGGRAFVERWIKELATPDPIYGDIGPFERAWHASTDLRRLELDPEYCWIFDTMAKLHPGRSPVIEHLQASREHR